MNARKETSHSTLSNSGMTLKAEHELSDRPSGRLRPAPSLGDLPNLFSDAGHLAAFRERLADEVDEFQPKGMVLLGSGVDEFRVVRRVIWKKGCRVHAQPRLWMFTSCCKEIHRARH